MNSAVLRSCLLFIALPLTAYAASHPSALNTIPQQNLPPAPVPQEETNPSTGAPRQPTRSTQPVPLRDKPLPHKAVTAASLIPEQPVFIPKLITAPKLEDFVSGDPESPAARNMQKLTGFIQQDPNDGAPVSEGTAAYIGYSAQNLYLAFVCRDRNPSLVRGHLVPRDEISDDDKVEVTLDTFYDHRRGLLFQVNPLGVQADATWTEGNSKPDYSFDTVWDTWGRRTSFGYVVLMRIPFQSLRFRHAEEGQPQIWGIVLRRWINHATERAYWPRVSRQIAGRLTQDAPIEGFASVERGRNLQIIPYVLGESYRRLDDRDPLAPTFDHKLAQGTAGVDLKAVIHDSLVLDATLNPDFSQVNVDDPAGPNQRFQHFFYEQRPFFIENASYFATPINLFYTLNIVSPQFGARLSGKQGPWAIGLLATDDRSPGQAVAPGNPAYNTRAQFYVSRIARDIGPFSSAGILYTDREYQGTYNRLGGADYRYRFHNQWTLTGQAVTSATRKADGTNQSGNSYKQNISFSGEHLYASMTYNDTSRTFLDAAGFFRRPDLRESHISSSYTWRPSGRYLLAHGPSVYLEQDWDHSGLGLDSIAEFSYGFHFNRNTNITPFLNVTNDRLRPVDYSTLQENVEYRSQVAGLSASTSPFTQLAMSVSGYAGQTVNYSPPVGAPPNPVNVQSINFNLELKPFTQLDLQNRYEFDRFRNPGSPLVAYDNNLVVSRWNLQLDRALAVRLIGVYQSTLPNAQFTGNENNKNLFTNALVSYIPHPGTAFYVGYTSNSENLDPALCTRLANGSCNPSGKFLAHSGDNLISTSSTLYVKLSYLLRF